MSSSSSSPPSPSRESEGSVYSNALAGAFAGALAKTLVAPIERVKLLLQLQSSSYPSSSSVAGSASSKPYLSALDAAKRVYKEQGLLSFWRGNLPNLYRHTGATALTFSLKDFFRSHFVPTRASSSDRPLLRPFLASLLSGGFAGFLSTALFYPLDFLRTRLAMDTGSDSSTRLYPRGMRDVLSTTLEVDGVRGLYKGMSVSLFGVVLFRALHLGSYDFLKAELLPVPAPTPAGSAQGEGEGGRKGASATATARGGDILSRVAIAQFVSVAAGTAVYPVDSVRRRLMMQAGKVDKLYETPMQCARVVLRTEGLRGFYKGIGPNVIRSVGGTIMLVSYDEFKALLNPKAPRLESYSV